MTLVCNCAIGFCCPHFDVLLFIIVADDYLYFRVLEDASTSRCVGSLLSFYPRVSDGTNSLHHHQQADLAVHRSAAYVTCYMII